MAAVLSPVTHLRQEGRVGLFLLAQLSFYQGALYSCQTVTPLIHQPEPDHMPSPRPTTGTGEWPSQVTPGAEDKPHLP